MRKDSFGSNQHLLILRVHSISVTTDMRDSFPELGLLGFPVFCPLICSTVSHREGKKWKDVIFQGCFCDSTFDSRHPQQTMEFFPILGFNIPSSQTPHPKGVKQLKVIIFSARPLPLIKATVRKSYFELFLTVGMGCSETSTKVSQFKTMPFR